MDRRAFLKFSAAAVGAVASPLPLIIPGREALQEKLLVTIPWGSEWMDSFRAMTTRYVKDYQISSFRNDFEHGWSTMILRRRDLCPQWLLDKLWGFYSDSRGVLRECMCNDCAEHVPGDTCIKTVV